MPAISADVVREQAAPVVKIFTENPDLKMKIGNQVFTAEKLAALNDSVDAADKAVDAKRAELTVLLNDRNGRAQQLNDVLVQARKAIAGYFGEDSNEYELAGGTRKSERSSPGRRKPTPAAVAK